MKPKDRREAMRQIKKILNLTPYNHDEMIIGDLRKDVYVQFIPSFRGYHRNGDKICVFVLDLYLDTRKKLHCPNCKKDLTRELLGLK